MNCALIRPLHWFQKNRTGKIKQMKAGSFPYIDSCWSTHSKIDYFVKLWGSISQTYVRFWQKIFDSMLDLIIQYDLLFNTEQRGSNWEGGVFLWGKIINLIKTFHHGNRKSNCQTARVVWGKSSRKIIIAQRGFWE